MILDQDRFTYQNSSYERPNFPFRCGRALKWGKPCLRGPNTDGSCGGTTECTPFFDDGRWQCRRSGKGGTCSEGPLPCGTCSQQQQPCQPARTIRGLRARVSIAMLAVSIALIAGFSFGIGRDGGFFLDPGPLSGIHQNFVRETGCVSCHEAHGDEPVAIIKAVFSRNSVSNACVDCHGFEGGVNDPHNMFPVSSAPHGKQTACVMCHSEHKGVDANLITMSDKQCHTCHEKKFESFTKGHPDFPTLFPVRERPKVAFDHTKHLNQYFVDPRNKPYAPEGGCVGCHDTAKAGRIIPIKPFDQVCAGCHETSIVDRPMLLFRLPELVANPFPDEAEGKKKEFESVSLELPTPITAMLLKVAADDPEAYSQPVGDLLRELRESGVEAFKPLVEEAGGNPATMLHGLPPELTKAVMAAWSKNKEYEPDAEPQGGWFANYLSIGYKPSGHSDKVLKAWLDFAAAKGSDTLREHLMSKSEGPGACIKCHAVSAKTESTAESKSDSQEETKPLKVEWVVGDTSETPFFAFNHSPHVNLLREGALCETCHILDAKADITAAFEQFDPKKIASNFAPIRKEFCAECHGVGAVSQSCVQCHNYHNEPSIKKAVGPRMAKKPIQGKPAEQ